MKQFLGITKGKNYSYQKFTKMTCTAGQAEQGGVGSAARS